jgi:AsmA protein
MKSKRIWVVLAVVVGVILIGLLALEHFLDADTYHGRIEAALSDVLGRQVQLGHLSFSIFSGSLEAATPSIADDPAFSHQPFLTAQDIKIGVKTWDLVFDHQLHVTGLTVDQPKITLLRRADGVWNYSSLGSKGQPSATGAAGGSLLPNLTVNRLDIKDGTLTVGTLPTQGQPHVYSNVNVSAKSFSFANAFPFTVSCKLPGGGTMNISGSAGPMDQQDASLTPFTAQVTLKNADLAQEFLGASQGIAGTADLDAKIVSKSGMADAHGNLHVTKMKLAKNGTPADEPVDMNFSVQQNLKSLSGTISKADVQIGKAQAAITGTYRSQGNTTTVDVNANGQSMPIDSLVAFLPSLGVQLPPGSKLQGGTLTATLNISGPVAASVVSGPVQINNTQLAGFDLGQKLSAIAALGGAKTGSNTTIQVLSTNLHYGPDGTQTNNLTAVVTGMGTATGNGSISPDEALNYHLRVKLSSGGVGGVATQAAGLLPGVLGSTVGQSMKNGIPVAITGTTSHPVFAPEIGQMFGNSGQTQTTKPKNPLGKVLGGMLGH